MAEAEYLIGLAQIALGLAGFSGVVVAYRNDPAKWSDADRMRFFLLLTTSIGAIFNTLLPLVFNALGINPPRLWHAASYSSLVCFTAIAISYYIWLFSLKRKGKAKDVDMYLTVFLSVGSLAAMILLVLNAFGTFGAPFGILFAVLVWGLFVPAVQFGRMVYMNFVKKPTGKDKKPPTAERKEQPALENKGSSAAKGNENDRHAARAEAVGSGGRRKSSRKK